MEAYARLVQETKNDRLHFLLNQTDTYLATINRMVQNQRDEADLEDAEEKMGITREMKEAREKELKEGKGKKGEMGDAMEVDGLDSKSSSSVGASSIVTVMDEAGGSSVTMEASKEMTSSKEVKGIAGVAGVAGVPGVKGVTEGSTARVMGTETLTKGGKDYYENTHKRNERVTQPQMLRLERKDIEGEPNMFAPAWLLLYCSIYLLILLIFISFLSQ